MGNEDLNCLKYYQDIPVGKDLYEEQTQEKLAESIKLFLKSKNSSDVKIIGLEGG